MLGFTFILLGIGIILIAFCFKFLSTNHRHKIKIRVANKKEMDAKKEVMNLEENKTKEKMVLPQEMNIYFGSQTGTSAGFSNTLGEESIQYGIKAKVLDLASFDPEVLSKQELVIFMVSSYGKGGPTDNAKRFFQWLNKDIKVDFLKNMKFAVFGCGDSGFPFFNKMAKITQEKILARGAKEYISFINMTIGFAKLD